jgi:hypothetical protein
MRLASMEVLSFALDTHSEEIQGTKSRLADVPLPTGGRRIMAVDTPVSRDSAVKDSVSPSHGKARGESLVGTLAAVSRWRPLGPLALLAVLTLAGCSTCEIAVGGAVFAHDPEKDVALGGDLRLLVASDEDRARLLVAHARKLGRDAGLTPVSQGTVTVRVLGPSPERVVRNVAIRSDGTFFVLVPGVNAKEFRAIVVETEACGFRGASWSFPKFMNWHQAYYDLAMQMVLERDSRPGR